MRRRLRLSELPLAGDRGGVYGPSVDFSDDGGRLMQLYRFEKPRPEDAGRRALLRVWDSTTGRELPVSQRSVGQQEPETPNSAWLPGKGDRVAVTSHRQVSGGKQPRFEDSLDIYTTDSGRHVRRVYGPVDSEGEHAADRGHGVWVKLREGVRWYSLVPGPNQPKGRLEGGINISDLTGTHLVREDGTASAPTGQFRRVTILDTRGDHRYWRATVPGKGVIISVAVVGSGPGPRTLLTADGDSLFRVRAMPVPMPLRARADDALSLETALAVSPDGSRTARLHEGRLEVLGPGTQVRETLPSEHLRKQKELSLRLLWVARKGADAVLVWSERATNALLYDAETLRRRENVTWDCGRTGRATWNLPKDIVQTADGELVLLCLGGDLVRLDPRTGVQSGSPIHLERTPQEPDSWPDPGQLTPRPGHRDQVAVVTDQWRERGLIEVWDTRRRTRVARLEGAPLSYDDARGMAFTPGGETLAALGEDRRVTWWRVDDERTDGIRTRSITDATGLLGVAGDGPLIVTLSGKIGLFSPASGEPLGRLEQPATSTLATWRLTGDTLRLLSDEDDWTVSLSPTQWHHTVCAAAPGPYSPAQRAAPRLDLARRTQPCPGARVRIGK